ncbi:MAG: hypothetical protein IPL39_06305 [Opitutaceae bacterium]|nr:hypothetical protein [Opitutaceae bacterium]
MKSLRVLLALSVFTVCAGLASAADAPVKKEQCDKADKTCAATCDKTAATCDKAKACPADCDKPCCKKDAAAMACCAEAAKAGKTCEKCNPPAKK